MSLVATPPIWAASETEVPTAALPDHAQVLIIGAGLTGCAVALYLAEAGWAPIVIEQHPAAGLGISSRDTGVAGPILNDTPHRLIAALGDEMAGRVVRFAQSSLSLAGDQGVFHQTGLLMAAGIPQEIEQHPIDAKALGTLGIAVDAWSPEEVAERTGTSAFGPGLWLSQAGVMARDGTARLAQKAAAAGAKFVFNTHATGLGGQGADTQVHTTAGTLQADVVILAVGAQLPQLSSWFEDKAYPVRTQLLAAPDPDGPLPFPIRTQLGHASLLAGPDQTLVANGCRWATAHLEAGEADARVVSPPVHDKLTQLAQRHRPTAGDPTHQWSSIMTFTCDGLPLIGPIPGRSRIIACAGFAGHQASLGIGAARAVADGLLGETHIEVPALFELSRFV